MDVQDGFADAMNAMGLKPHPEQIVIANRMAKLRDACKVGFLEAPTATGKTLVVGHFVTLWPRPGEKRVVAVPTIALAHQTAHAIAALSDRLPDATPVRVRVVLGRQEFLSIPQLQDLVGALPQKTAQAISEWIAADGPGRTAHHPSWTRDGLAVHLDASGEALDVSGIPSLTAGDAGAAAEAYAAQFDDEADVLVVTHAMLAHDLLSRFVALSKRRKAEGLAIPASLSPAETWLAVNGQRLELESGDEGRLPDYRHLVVDEAHLLRESFESAMSSQISLTSLVRQLVNIRNLSPSSMDKSIVDKVKAVRDELVRHAASARGDRIRISWTSPSALNPMIARLHEALERVNEAKVSGVDPESAAGVARARRALAESLHARDSVSTVFEWSPVARFPSITVGRRNLSAQFDLLWKRLDTAVLVSATLYTENVGGPSSAFTAARLCVPAELVRDFPPIASTWTKDPVDAVIPGPETALRLNAPNGDMDVDQVAAEISRIAHGSNGMLVLSTRRSTSHELSLAVAALVGADRVLDGTTDSLSALRLRYERMARAGLRPIWFGQGPAWTGLDLPDDVLDTLVVARLPYPTPDAVGENEAVRYGPDKIARMLMTLKQGIGRLVRVRDARPKLLAVLDGRIQTQKNARGALVHLKSYHHTLI